MMPTSLAATTASRYFHHMRSLPASSLCQRSRSLTRQRFPKKFSTPSVLQSPQFTNKQYSPSCEHRVHCQTRIFSTSLRDDKEKDPKKPDSTSKDSADVEEEVEKTKSNRQLFREIPVNAGILAYIRSVGVGIVPRQRRSTRMNSVTDGRRIRGKSRQIFLESVSRQNKQAERIQSPPPLPFGSDAFPVRVVAEIHGPSDKMPALLDGIPTDQIPQVALCGRSNVGKSTMINALLYGNRPPAPETTKEPAEKDKRETEKEKKKKEKRKKNEAYKLPKGIKASVSPRPGETRHITLYQLGAPSPKDKTQDLRLLLVDLPGYGFAFANEETKVDFQSIMVQYLTGIGHGEKMRPPKRILMLLDARHGMKKSDIDFLGMLQMAILEHKQQQLSDAKAKPHERKRKVQLPPVQLVLTKCDLVPQDDLARRVVQARQQLSDTLIREASQLPVMLCSARSQMEGILEIQKELASMTVSVTPVRPPKKEPPVPPPQSNRPPKSKVVKKPPIHTPVKRIKERHPTGRNGAKGPRRMGRNSSQYYSSGYDTGDADDIRKL